MGLLETLLGKGVPEEDTAEGPTSPLASIFSGLLEKNGGLQGLIDTFQEKGLGGLVASWIGTGANQAISPEQIQQVLGDERVAQLAASLGLEAQQASQFLSHYLPQIIDKLTPDGKVTDGGGDSGWSSLLQAGLGSLLGRRNPPA